MLWKKKLAAKQVLASKNWNMADDFRKVIKSWLNLLKNKLEICCDEIVVINQISRRHSVFVSKHRLWKWVLLPWFYSYTFSNFSCISTDNVYWELEQVDTFYLYYLWQQKKVFLSYFKFSEKAMENYYIMYILNTYCM